MPRLNLNLRRNITCKERR